MPDRPTGVLGLNFSMLHWNSLKTRVTLFTLTIFLVSIWSLAFYSGRMLRNGLERQLSEQQYATVSLIAADIDQELALRLNVLANVAAVITPAMMANSAALQAHLLQQPVFDMLVPILDGPMAAIGREDALWMGLFG